MNDIPRELSAEFYTYDDYLIGITKHLLTTHLLNSPSKEEFAPLMDLIRYNAVNNISDDSSSALGDYLEQAMRYTYSNVHALAIFLHGHTRIEELLPFISDNLSLWNFLPGRYIDNGINLLIRAIRDYRINIDVLLKDPQNFTDKFRFLTLWLALKCCEELSEEFDEQVFLSLFYDKAYIFAEFLTIYQYTLSGKFLKPRPGVPRTPQFEVLDWLFDR